MVDKTMLSLSFWTADGIQPALRSPAPDAGSHHVDVSIADICNYWPFILEKKHKAAIDLDNWVTPAWVDDGLHYAAGYLDEHKTDDGKMLKSPMALVAANLSSSVTDQSREFTLFSSLAEPHGYYLSGISGGPIVTLQDDKIIPVGLVFEGEPASRAASAGYAGPNDIMVRGIILTPDRFADWLARSGLSA